jgi:hypothetical protein
MLRRESMGGLILHTRLYLSEREVEIGGRADSSQLEHIAQQESDALKNDSDFQPEFVGIHSRPE